ncbi:MAG: gliding motility protein GldC [Cyclobacteriaceae bacterium]|nr:gliding motility protein GldC [Cyclobacteriaceae bacterium]
MKKSEIKITIELDDKNIPEKINWEATDRPGNVPSSTKAFSLTLWDDQNKSTPRIDLWTKDMPVNEMKKYYIDCLGGLAQTLLSATGDEFMSSETHNLCEKLIEYLKNPDNQ